MERITVVAHKRDASIGRFLHGICTGAPCLSAQINKIRIGGMNRNGDIVAALARTVTAATGQLRAPSVSTITRLPDCAGKIAGATWGISRRLTGCCVDRY